MVQFVIFTGPIRTGKTTFLFHHIEGRKDVSGFLTPDQDGIRVIFDIQHQRWVDFEVTNSKPHDLLIEVGKFTFYQSSFDYCADLMHTFLEAPTDVFIIDEIGKLEMNGKGLEPSLSEFFDKVTLINTDSIIILVVRESLLDSFFQKYNLHNNKVLEREDLQNIFHNVNH